MRIIYVLGLSLPLTKLIFPQMGISWFVAFIPLLLMLFLDLVIETLARMGKQDIECQIEKITKKKVPTDLVFARLEGDYTIENIWLTSITVLHERGH